MLGMLGMILAVAIWLVGFGNASDGQSMSEPAPPPSTMQLTIAAMPLAATDGKIYVNQNCDIFPGLVIPFTQTKKPTQLWDSNVCHLENVLSSEHNEERQIGTELLRSKVEVHEQEYVLQNPTGKRVVFAVLVAVPKGWTVDSDPQPVRTEGDAAVFEVRAAPGEQLRLHVGMRHTKALTPKALAAGNGY